MNKLQHIDEFRELLANYRLSDTARRTLQETRLMLLVGPTSSGKNTIIDELVNTGSYYRLVSDTTREPRENNGVMEQDGLQYWFRHEDDVLRDIQNGAFLEASIIHNQQVSGISVRELEKASKQGCTAVNEIEVIGADNVHAAKPDTLTFFVVPPSFDEWMARMNARGKLPAPEVRRRLESAMDEITTALGRSYYRFVINDTFAHAARRLDAIARGEDTVNDQEPAKDIAARLLMDTKRYLASES